MRLLSMDIGLIGLLGLLGVGFYGLMVSRNLIKVVIALQILVKAALLGLVVAGSECNKINLVQGIGVTVIVADTVVAVIGMAFAIQVRQRLGTLDVRKLSKLRG